MSSEQTGVARASGAPLQLRPVCAGVGTLAAVVVAGAFAVNLVVS